jgi:hypothetical protein
MKKFATFALATGAALALVACGSADDASTEAAADTVEMPADEALEPVSEEPVADPAANAPDAAQTPDPTTAETAEAAANVAAEAAAAAAASEATAGE